MTPFFAFLHGDRILRPFEMAQVGMPLVHSAQKYTCKLVELIQSVLNSVDQW
jgi:hypothetical protein